MTLHYPAISYTVLYYQILTRQEPGKKMAGYPSFGQTYMVLPGGAAERTSVWRMRARVDLYSNGCQNIRGIWTGVDKHTTGVFSGLF